MDRVRCPICADLVRPADHKVGSPRCNPPKNSKGRRVAVEDKGTRVGGAMMNAGTPGPLSPIANNVSTDNTGEKRDADPTVGVEESAGCTPAIADVEMRSIDPPKEQRKKKKSRREAHSFLMEAGIGDEDSCSDPCPQKRRVTPAPCADAAPAASNARGEKREVETGLLIDLGHPLPANDDALTAPTEGKPLTCDLLRPHSPHADSGASSTALEGAQEGTVSKAL